MSGFNSNRNALAAALNRIKSDTHSFVAVDMPRGSRYGTVDKRKLLRAVETAIDAIDTDDFGTRILIARLAT